jgi:hypothetical protein
LTALAPGAGLLEAPEWHVRMQRVDAIDPRRSRMQPVCELNPARNILREHRRSEAIEGVVRLSQDILLVVEFYEDTNWSENFLLDDAHVRSRLGEDRWLDPIACGAMLLASKVHLCTVFLTRFDITHDTL